MKPSTYSWKPTEIDDDLTSIEQYLAEHQLSKDLAPLLWKRHIHTAEDVEKFLHPSVEQLHNPFLLHDMQKAVERIQTAIMNQERILIYGDYDCDGITSTTIVKETLEILGAEPEFYLPNRFTDGYGPNLSVYKYFIDSGVDLIITVDNGIAGLEAIQYATDHNVDVIITDHHTLLDTLPNAYATIHPRHPESEYPFNDLAGVGVAFKLATALLGYVPEEFFDLVTIGTIADVVSLTNENRALVKLGLKYLQQTDRLGLQALAKVGGIDLEHATEQTVGFAIAPRLNALGRLKDANPAVTLLSTFDDEEAMLIANEVEELNNERKALSEKMTDEALAMIDEKAPVQILAHQDWHEGILGIVASKVTEKTQCPSLVLAIDKETGIAKGSGRSISAVNLVDLLEHAADDLETFGGHHMAAGLSLKVENLEHFKQTLIQTLDEQSGDAVKETLDIDAILMPEELTLKKVEDLQWLAPFGTDNPIPIFQLNAPILQKISYMGKTEKHMKAIISQAPQPAELIQFNFDGSLRDFIQPNTQFAGELSINEWQGKKTVQFRLKDYQITGIQLYDGRGQRFMEEDFMCYPSTFVYFQKRHQRALQKWLPQTPLVHSNETIQAHTQLVLLDTPESLDQLGQLIQQTQCERYVLVFHSFEDAAVNGAPDRETFTKLFRFIHQYSEVDVRHQLNQIAQTLALPVPLLTMMIKAFEELGFVTITDGIMRTIPTPAKRSLDESKHLQRYRTQVEAEEFLLYQDIQTLHRWFSEQLS